MVNEPLMIWNLILCVIAFPSLGWFIRRELTNIQDTAKERSAELKSEIKKVSECLTTVKVDLENKIDRADCELKGKDKWQVIYHHKHTEDGEVVVPN